MSEELENLEQRLLASPTARARFLADTLEMLERNGVDTSSAKFQQEMQGAFDVSHGVRFMSGLAASTVVIAIASAGQRAAAGSQIGNVATLLAMANAIGGSGAAGKIGQAASTVVIAIASAGQRGAATKIGQAASTVVIAIASAGQRAAIGSSIGQAASTVVIAIASAGQRGALGSKIGQAASTVVIAIASAGGRSAGLLRGGFESASDITITLPATATLVEVAQALHQLADTLIGESAALEQEMEQAREALEGPGEPS